MPIKAIVDGVEKEITRISVLANSIYKNAWEVRDNQDRLLWYREDTLTGTSSITYKGYGIPLKSIKIVGNTQQTGVPDPDNPVYPEFVGERSDNLASSYNATGYLTQYNAALFANFDIKPNTEYTLSFDALQGATLYANEHIFTSSAAFVTDGSRYHVTLVTKSSIPGDQYISGLGWLLLKNALTLQSNPQISNVMLNSGSTALPYEPYGYKIPITCAGQTTPIYLGQTQTVRKIKKLVLDGTENWFATGGGDTLVYNTSLNVSGVPDPTAGSICTHLEYGDRYTQGQYDIGESGAMRISAKGFTSLSVFKQFLVDEYAADTPVTIWYVLAESSTGIVNEPLAKIGTYVDELITVPGITPQTGTNTLTVDTTLSPSLLSITGHVKEVST